MTEHNGLLELFPCCEPIRGLVADLEQVRVTGAVADRSSASLRIELSVPAPLPPVVCGRIEELLAQEFLLREVHVRAQARGRSKAGGKTGTRAGGGEKARAAGSQLLLGKRPPSENVVPIGDLTPDAGRVTVEGEVFGTELRTVKRGNDQILEFNMHDHTGSVRVSVFLDEQTPKQVAAIRDGMFLRISGSLRYNNWYGDLVLTPNAIAASEKEERMDRAEGAKRVELHMHTRFSSLDALTDIGAMVKTAARWGHKAVAVTDHGVVQAFPIIRDAGKKYGVKILYGVEGYYINDYDDRVVVSGESTAALDDEFVAFDLETTGLSAEKDRITEIGAVIYRNGEVAERFESFVDPERSIPHEVVQLTGIRDSDVQGAPREEQAVRAFLDFVGARPMAAHNADFDMGFLAAACRRHGIPFPNTSLDTLTLSQNLLPDLKKHTLDAVAGHLGLPEFHHHRASDDGVTVAYILRALFPRLREMGITRLDQINPAMPQLRGRSSAKRQPKHIILLVKSQPGIRNLYKIVSLAHLEHFRKQPIIPKSLLMENREGIIVGSACENGEIYRAVLGHKSDAELRRLASFYDFLEIQPLCNNRFMVENGTVSGDEELRELNRRIVRLGEEMGKPVVATGDVHFLEPEDEIFRRVLLANKYSDADRPLPLYFKTTDEMLEEFSYLGEEKAREIVVDNTNLIADWCDEVAPLPTGLFTPKIENSVEELKSLVYGKAHALYGEGEESTLPKIVLERIEAELKDIIGCGYDVIYMSAQKLVAKSLAAGYLVGSRGSVGSSLVAFMSGITEVNALPAHYRCPNCHHADFDAGQGYGCGADMPDANCPVCGAPYDKDGFDIPFETFLGFGGDKVPDIDLNFSGEYQARAHRDTIELFGAEHVFRAGTIGTIAEKTAYGYVKKYMEERGIHISKAEEARLAAGLTGVKRTTGQHPGGLVVIPQDKEIYDFCPVQHPADDKDSDIITTHFEYHSMESNLLKLDELGHDDPTMIRMMEDLTGVDAQKIRLDDPETRRIFRTPEPLGLPDDDPVIGKTGSIGIPEFGTGFTRQMLVDTQPSEFDTLVRLSGFSHGTDVWLGNAKELILSGTATVNETIGCRDDIMLYLIARGLPEKRAFKIMESVRKGRGLPEGAEEEMIAAGVPDWYIESCKKIKYLFPKAHAVAYVMMAFRIAWFKVHEPLAFYAAYFYRRSQKDSFDADCMLNGLERVQSRMQEIERNPAATAKELDLLTTLEAVYEFYKRGFRFSNIDLNRSDATRFLIEDGALRPPFVAISGLGESAALDLIQAREGGSFISVEEVSAACPKVSKTHIDQLKKAGAFGDLPDSAQFSLF